WAPIPASSCCCQAPNLPWAPITASSCCCQVPESLMGPCTASHCCCLHRHTLPCMPLSGLLTHCWCVPFFCHRLLTDYGPPHCCCRPVICHGASTAWSRCCWVHSVTWVPVPRLPLLPSLPCATLRSPHTPAVFHFVIGCCRL
ncbi:unnamed protein product, partial [Staurois parvus]